MLSSILRSKRALAINIEIMRAFVRFLANPVNDLERLNDWNYWNRPCSLGWNGPIPLVRPGEIAEILHETLSQSA